MSEGPAKAGAADKLTARTAARACFAKDCLQATGCVHQNNGLIIGA